MKLTFILKCCEYLKFPVNKNRKKMLRVCGYLLYRVLSYIENIAIKHTGLPLNVLNTEKRNEKIIVSLTSYPGRIDVVHLTIKSLMLQTYKPDRIVLWLAETQFPDHKLPEKLLLLCNKGLEIKFCNDYRSHKKYILILQEQKEDELVITFDDDIIYNVYSIERAVNKHNEFPNAIVCNEVKNVSIDESGNVRSYNKWSSVKKGKNKPSFKYSPMTGSGCLYPYKALPAIAFDMTEIVKYARSTDDLWIMFVSVINNIMIVSTDIPAKTFTTVSASQNSHLGSENCIEGGNDKAIRLLVNRFPEYYDKIKS